MKTKITLLALAAAALAMCGCEVNTDEDYDATTDDLPRDTTTTTTDDIDDDDDMTPDGAGAAAISEDAGAFVRDAASGGLFEVRSAEHALNTLPQGDPLRDVAQMILDDHRRANDELMRIAQSKGVSAPAAMNDDHEELFADLRDTAIEDYAATFRDMQIEAHDDAIALFEDAAENIDDPDIRLFAQNTLPTLRRHRDALDDAEGGG